MNKIHVLDQNTIDKIAAGEVVERPASIVKELVENAIDAGASRITIEITSGGIHLIRITDDGKGIPADDIRLAFLRHATSKINSVDDLTSILSLGFRGEALSSIAAVSRVELITKESDDLTAVRYVIEGGREKLYEEIGAPDGTTIVVRDVFYNTPARAKFLKTATTEAAHVGAYVEQLALSNPQIGFDFIVNGSCRISTTGSGNLKDVLYNIYGRELVSQLLSVDAEADGIRIKGYIAKPSVSRGNRNFENYYVNGRYVKSRAISLGIEEGYGNKLMGHQYPFTCLMITVDGSFVDVNVHPAKMEVRFSDERIVLKAVADCVRDVLYRQEMIIRSSLNPPEKHVEKKARQERYAAPAPFETNALREKDAGKDYSENAFAEKANVDNGSVVDGFAQRAENDNAAADVRNVAFANGNTVGSNPNEMNRGRHEIYRTREDGIAVENSRMVLSNADSPIYEQQTLMEMEPSFLSPEASPNRKIIGCAFQTYWIIEYGDKLYMIDQHAAHEKVLFCRFMKEYENGSVSSQQLSPPLILNLDSMGRALIEEYREAFVKAGFEIESFGGNDIKIGAVPYHMSALGSGKLFMELLDHLEVSTDPKKLKIYEHRVATEACKAAVKGGNQISLAEAKALIDELFLCEDPYHCPHGRPTIISFTEKDIEKRFKRII